MTWHFINHSSQPSGLVGYTGELFGGTAANSEPAASGDNFLLTASDNLLAIGPNLGDNSIFIYGTHDMLALSYPGAGDRIYDHGQGTTIQIMECSATSLDHMVAISGFQNDPTATLRISDPQWWKGGPPAITPDGHGGTLVGNFVDLIGDHTVSAAQVSCFRPTV